MVTCTAHFELKLSFVRNKIHKDKKLSGGDLSLILPQTFLNEADAWPTILAL